MAATRPPQRVDLRLVGDQPPGTWVLVFLGAAREVIDEQRAMQTRDALEALRAVQAGRVRRAPVCRSDRPRAGAAGVLAKLGAASQRPMLAEPHPVSHGRNLRKNTQ